MTTNNQKFTRVLGIAASTRGIGFALMEGRGELVDWGVKVVTSGHKNARCLSNVANLVSRYRPDIIAVEHAQSSLHGERVRALTREIVSVAKNEKIKVRQFTRKQVSLGLLSRENRSRRALAKYLAARFPEELSFRLPERKRREYESEDYRMDIFEATGLAYYCVQLKNRSRLDQLN